MNQRFKLSGFLLLICLFFLSSCKEDFVIPPPGKYDNGILVSNEGPFQNGTGTISFISRDSGFVLNDIFETENGRPLGNIVQSVSLHLGRAYIVVNNANKIEVVNASDFKSIGTIEGFQQPRYFTGVDGQKAYVTEWGASGSNGAVKVVDLTSLTVTDTFGIGGGPERMLRLGDKIYVANSGGFLSNNKVFVFNTINDVQVGVIEVGDSPNGLQLDNSASIWVLCGGKKVYNPDFTLNLAASTAGSFHIINGLTDMVEEIITFTDVSLLPGNLVINTQRSMLYYTTSVLHEQPVNTNILDEQPFLNVSCYGLAIDPLTGNIYCSDARDFNSNGAVEVYTPAGSLLETYGVGIIPGNFQFQ